jgi:uncharacterized cysteine cluster protein YcgN (CxxCxxCC family)
MYSTDNAALTQVKNAKIKKIIKIMNDYENNLSDGYGYYCGYKVGGEERMLTHVASAMLYINDDETPATKIKQIINVLKNFEENLSDGYGHYCGNAVGSEERMLAQIAKVILAVLTMVTSSCPCCGTDLTIMITRK